MSTKYITKAKETTMSTKLTTVVKDKTVSKTSSMAKETTMSTKSITFSETLPLAPLAARDALPAPEGEPRPFSLWSFLKDAAGKQLFALPLPIGFYLPLTEVQFRLENLEYASLLDEAAACAPGSVERAARVAAFALSHNAAAVRLRRPFMAMHGETFDVVDPHGKYRAMGEAVFTSFREQTIRHALVAESTTIVVGSASGSCSCCSSSSSLCCSSRPLWTVESDDQPVVGFKGTHLDLHLNWRDLITFADGEAFAYMKPTSVLGNLLSKSHTLTHRGMLSLRSSKGIGVDLEFLEEPGGGFSKLASMMTMRGSSNVSATVEHEVKGVFVRKHGGGGAGGGEAGRRGGAAAAGCDDSAIVDDDEYYQEADIGSGEWSPIPGAPILRGQWHEGLWQHDAGDTEVGKAPKEKNLLWNVDLDGEKKKLEPRFYMSPFAVRLNARDAALDATLPPTDSRRRPDLWALEEGRFDDAYVLKMRLENALVARVNEHEKRVTATAAEAKKKKKISPSSCDDASSPAPRWFEERSPGSLLLKAGTQALRYRYKGGYWESRATGKWEDVDEEIFMAAADISE